ncbi:MAG: FxsA family protein [Chitinispirillaceae bacterium]
MLLRLIVLFTVFPLIELFLLIEIGRLIGALNTVLIVVATAILGAALAKREGLVTLSRIRMNLSRGIMPTEELFDGLLILIAGMVLITPGLITDTCGFLLLIRPTRKFFKKLLKKKFSDWIDRGYTEIHFR